MGVLATGHPKNRASQDFIGGIMMRYLNLCALVFTLALSTQLRAAILAGPISSPVNGHTYYLLSAASWTTSETAAVGLGGHLATDRSQAENDWLFSTFAGYATNSTTDLWIGLKDPTANDGAAHASNFAWISGDSSSYRNWASGEPNNDPNWGGEQYGALALSPYGSVVAKTWNDENVDASGRTAMGVVEIVPEPTMPIVMAVLVCLLSCRKQITHRSVAVDCQERKSGHH